MGHVSVGHHWDRVAMDILDMSVTTPKGNRYVSFGTTAPEVLQHLEEVLERLSAFRLQLKVKKCTFMQTEVAFLGHIVGRAGLARNQGKVSEVRA